LAKCSYIEQPSHQLGAILQFTARRDHVAAALIFVLAVIYAIPFLLSARPYIDDLGRIMRGYSSWSIAGRPLADFVMERLNFGRPLADISPLPQMLGIAAVAIAAYLLYRATVADKMPLAVPAVAASMLLLNPALLECMSYKFDALPMGLSILLAVWAALPTRRHILLAVAGRTVAVVAALCFYQVSVSLVPGIALIAAMMLTLRGESSNIALEHILRVALSFVFGLAVYWALSLLLPIGAYGRELSTPLPFSLHGLGRMAENVARTTTWVLQGFSPSQQLMLAIFAVLAWAYAVYLAVVTLRREGPMLARLLLAALYGASPLLLLLCWFGLSNLFQIVFLAPRMFIGIGATAVFITLLPALGVLDGLRALRVIPAAARTALSVAVVAIPALFSIVMDYAMGTAQAAQRRFDDLVVTQTIEAFDREGIQPGVLLLVDGAIPFAPDAGLQIAKFPVLGKNLVPRYLTGRWPWGMALFRTHGFELKQPPEEGFTDALEAASREPPFFENRLFALTRSVDAVVLRFKQSAR
jgi:hypothetical protein